MYRKKVNTHKAHKNWAKQEEIMNNTTTLDVFSSHSNHKEILLWHTKHGYVRRKKSIKKDITQERERGRCIRTRGNMQPSAIEYSGKQLLRPVVMETQQENQ